MLAHGHLLSLSFYDQICVQNIRGATHTLYPDEAVDEIKDEILAVARRWYRVGAKRGALEVLEAIMNGDITIEGTDSDTCQLTAHIENISWTKSLNVSVGAEKRKIAKKSYNLSVKELGFE